MVYQGGGGERISFYCVEFSPLAAAIWLIHTEHCQHVLVVSVSQQNT